MQERKIGKSERWRRNKGIGPLVRRKGVEILDILGIIPTLIVIVIDVFHNRIRSSRAGEVGDETESRNTNVGLRSIELRNNIGCPRSLAHNYHRTKVPRLCLTGDKYRFTDQVNVD